MKGAIAWFAHNHVAANLLLGLIVLSGLVAVVSMPQKSFPDLDIPIISHVGSAIARRGCDAGD